MIIVTAFLNLGTSGVTYAPSISGMVFEEKKADNSQTLPALNDIGRSVSLWKCTWTYSPIVDADVIDQAIEVGTGGYSVPDANT